jgi:hypothetical protein
MTLILGLLACGLTGCTGIVRNASETAVPIVVDSGLGELATAKSQAQLKSIAASPAVQEAGYGVGLGIGRGILDEGTAFLGGSASKSDEPPVAVGVAANGQNGGDSAPTANSPTTQVAAGTPRTRPATAAATTAPATTTASTAVAPTKQTKGEAFLEANITPAVGGVIRSAVTEGLSQASGPQSRAQVQALAESAGDGFMTGVARAAEREGTPLLSRMFSGAFTRATGPDGQAALSHAAQTLGEGLGSGLARSADRDGSPVVGRLVHDQIDPAVADAARQLGPVLHELLEKQVAPAARDLVAECVRDTLKMPVRPENAPDVVANARNVSTGAGQATHEALIGMGFLDASGQWSLPLRVTIWGGSTLAALVGTASLVLLSLRILIAWREWRRGPAGQA